MQFPTRIKVLELLKDLLLFSLHQVTLPLSYTVCHLGKQVMEGRHCRFLFGREGELGETGVYKNLLSLRDTSCAVSLRRTRSPQDKSNWHEMFVRFTQGKILLLPVNQGCDLRRKMRQRLQLLKDLEAEEIKEYLLSITLKHICH